jgi:hypothetical protein
MHAALLVLSFAAALVAPIRGEQHTVVFDNQCGHGTVGLCGVSGFDVRLIIYHTAYAHHQRPSREQGGLFHLQRPLLGHCVGVPACVRLPLAADPSRQVPAGWLVLVQRRELRAPRDDAHQPDLPRLRLVERHLPYPAPRVQRPGLLLVLWRLRRRRSRVQQPELLEDGLFRLDVSVPLRSSVR